MSLLQGHVSATYVRLLHEYLAARGRDPVAVLGEPAPATDAGSLLRVPVAHWAALLAKADAELREPALGLAVGARIQPAHFGLLGYLTLCCATLGDARFMQVSSPWARQYGVNRFAQWAHEERWHRFLTGCPRSENGAEVSLRAVFVF